ncbi:MAG: hypothetical protein ABJD07_11230 [Gemmatimonadaceae bacterium]
MKLELLPVRDKQPAGVVWSVVIHLVFGALLIWVLALPYPLSRLFSNDQGATIPVEKISFLRLPDRGTTTAGRSGGDDRPIAPRAPEPPRLVAPTTVPTTIPIAPVATLPTPVTGGNGPLIGRGGAVQGVTPSYHDSPLWAIPTEIATAPKSVSQKLDSALSTRIAAHNDTVDAYYRGHKLERGDWTFERDGKKFGIDSSGLHLGSITIPSMLLPHFQPNTAEQLAKNRAIAMVNQEVRESAQRAMNADEFREAVKRIRERKEREKREGTQVLTP